MAFLLQQNLEGKRLDSLKSEPCWTKKEMVTVNEYNRLIRVNTHLFCGVLYSQIRGN